MDRQECCYWKRVSSGPANKRQIQSMSKPIHAFVLCSSVFAKLTLGSDKAILITGLSFWTGPLLIFKWVLSNSRSTFRLPSSFPWIISQQCHFKCNRLHHPEPPVMLTSCSLVKLCSPKKEAKNTKMLDFGLTSSGQLVCWFVYMLLLDRILIGWKKSLGSLLWEEINIDNNS